MRKTTACLATCLLTLALAALTAPAGAQYPVVYRPAYAAQPARPVTGPMMGPSWAYPAPALLSQSGISDSPAAFLAALNGYRARAGLAPLAWDAGLAAAAATNGGVHAPGSNGGGLQAWAGVRSYSQGLALWLASPSHRAILLGGTAIGVSVCPTGLTANVR